MKVQQLIRYDKIFTDSFYLLNKFIDNDNFIFELSGSTRNIYKVRIYSRSKMIFCNCPDSYSHGANQGVICKHSCFVIFKVLKLFDTIESSDAIEFFNRLHFTLDQIEIIKTIFNQLNINSTDE